MNETDMWNRLNEMRRDMDGMLMDMLGNINNACNAKRLNLQSAETHKTNAIKKFMQAKRIMERMQDELMRD